MLFPAIVIAGPPHSGKSVLIYSLSQALRNKQIPHYVLRACPDGEGDWANEADQHLVKILRMNTKGTFSTTYIQKMTDLLHHRVYPLLVDVGGRPTAEQEAIFDLCTHAVLLMAHPTQEETKYASSDYWLSLFEHKNIQLLAHLQSELKGQSHLEATTPYVKGVITQLNRGQKAQGVAFDALVEQIKKHITHQEDKLTQYHQENTPAGYTFVDLTDLPQKLGGNFGRWEPHYLTKLDQLVPPHQKLALYGRSAMWAYSALAIWAYPAEMMVFNAHQGWITPPLLPTTNQPTETQPGWAVHLSTDQEWTIVDIHTKSQYLEPDNPAGLPLPHITGSYRILSGKLPNWLYSSLARQWCTECAVIGIYQPNLKTPAESKVVIIYSTEPEKYQVGTTISYTLKEIN